MFGDQFEYAGELMSLKTTGRFKRHQLSSIFKLISEHPRGDDEIVNQKGGEEQPNPGNQGIRIDNFKLV